MRCWSEDNFIPFVSNSRAFTNGALRATWESSGGTLELSAGRRLQDLPDRPILSRMVNSLLAQEGGRDQGDYALVDRAILTVTRRLDPSTTVTLGGGVERSRSVSTEATPASGTYRPNPPLGAGTIGIGRVGIAYRQEALDGSRSTDAGLAIEAGRGDRDYARITGRIGWLAPAGPGGLMLRAEAGVGTTELPGYRSFAIGGWGTLPGEAFRAWGGRQMALATLEYRLAVPFPAIPLGAFASTGDRIMLAPFIAAGWAGGSIAALPWRPSHELRPVAGLAVEWFQRLLRAEGGVSLRTGKLGISVDVNRNWWEIL